MYQDWQVASTLALYNHSEQLVNTPFTLRTSAAVVGMGMHRNSSGDSTRGQADFSEGGEQRRGHAAVRAQI
jgi:hypothetical protein